MCVRGRGANSPPASIGKLLSSPACDSQGGTTDWGCDLGAPTWGLCLHLFWTVIDQSGLVRLSCSTHKPLKLGAFSETKFFRYSDVHMIFNQGRIKWPWQYSDVYLVTLVMQIWLRNIFSVLVFFCTCLVHEMNSCWKLVLPASKPTVWYYWTKPILLTIPRAQRTKMSYVVAFLAWRLFNEE